MRTLASLCAAVVFSSSLMACGKGGSSSSSSSSGGALGPSSGSTLTYSNGDPIVTPTSNTVVLGYEEQVVDIVNNYRVANGKSALIETGNVADLARGHSAHMIQHSFFNHVNPEGDTPGGRFNKADIGWQMVGENLAGGFPSAQSAFDAWMASPGHKANIDLADWTHTGVGYAYDPGSTYRYYWTQNFVKP